MLDILVRLHEQFGCVGVKAEFEAEGTRLEELLRLVDISRQAGVKIGIKIGGCEAIKDILDAKQIGVDYLIAPMIESEYALSKYDASLKRVYSMSDIAPAALFNVETISGFDCVDELVSYAANSEKLNGIVFGRVDYTLSRGLDRDQIDSDNILRDCSSVAALSAQHDLEFVVGGGVSCNAIEFLKEIRSIRLDRFETRKIIFRGESLEIDSLKNGLLLAVKFELLWLINKKDYYKTIGAEDDVRIDMLETRWNVL